MDTYDIGAMSIWPPLDFPLDPTGRLDAIRAISESTMPAKRWAGEMLEHVQKHVTLGWPLHRAMQYAAAECRAHLPKELL